MIVIDSECSNRSTSFLFVFFNETHLVTKMSLKAAENASNHLNSSVSLAQFEEGKLRCWVK